MTIEQALDLRDGDYVCHSAGVDYRSDGTPVKRPMRVTKVWVNAKRTSTIVRLASVAGQQWIDAMGYELPPQGMVYDRHEREWITPKELRERKAHRRVSA